MSRYTGTEDFSHEMPDRTGILLCNLGTPEAPTPSAVRRYLAEFLSDPRVVEIPRLLWKLILHTVILRTRPRHVAKAYAKVWTDAGSPLLAISRRQQAALQKHLGGQVTVALGMCYGKPSIAEALNELRRAGVRRLLILPLYPQYSATTTGAVFDAVVRELGRWRWLPELRMINHYHDEPAYIEALAASVQDYWAEQGRSSQRLMMSFHGLPKASLEAGDPYYCECQKTARLLAEKLGLAETEWKLTFQSRFGPAEWLQPYTDETLQTWAQTGVDSVDTVCPGFAADCLETLEEMAIQNRDLFLQHGGREYRYIPALNDSVAHIEALAGLLQRHLQGWGVSADATQRQRRQQRARSLGAQK
ncbi:ferrochelatase [Sulfuriflexus mobilis]|uniref:ferrochelatase n=1 Tax=Sulfuriflexus mobilis TaxID=1811807 RepID=UPI000F8245B4|nr:ferrochelatase [Sulfuriflexus mobilis]